MRAPPPVDGGLELKAASWDAALSSQHDAFKKLEGATEAVVSQMAGVDRRIASLEHSIAELSVAEIHTPRRQ